jgi:hypothetical protein
MPVAHAARDIGERTYQRLLGPLKSNELTVWAECLFADPISDVAALGAPDSQDLYDEASAYDVLTENASALRIGSGRSGTGWVLALDGHWIPTRLDVLHGMRGFRYRLIQLRPECQARQY